MIRTRPNTAVSSEELVLSVIMEYLEENRTFWIKEIIPYISSRMAKTSKSLTLNGIKKIFNTLIKQKIVLEGSKLTRDTLLDNQNRFELYMFVKRNPGLYFNAIIKNTEVDKYVVYTHLQTLIKFGLIKSEKIRNNIVYFEPYLTREQVKKLYYKSKKKSKRIISYLDENNIGVTKTQMSTELKIHMNTLGGYLIDLEKCKLISKEKISGKILYFPLE